MGEPPGSPITPSWVFGYGGFGWGVWLWGLPASVAVASVASLILWIMFGGERSEPYIVDYGVGPAKSI